MHAPISCFPLLPNSAGSVNKGGGIGLSDSGSSPRCLDIAGRGVRATRTVRMIWHLSFSNVAYNIVNQLQRIGGGYIVPCCRLEKLRSICNEQLALHRISVCYQIFGISYLLSYVAPDSRGAALQ